MVASIDRSGGYIVSIDGVSACLACLKETQANGDGQQDRHQDQTDHQYIARHAGWRWNDEYWLRDRLGPDASSTRCLIPRFDGAILLLDWKEALWGKYVTAAPRPRTPSEQQYSDRKLRPR